MKDVSQKLNSMKIVIMITVIILFAELSWAITFTVSPDGNDANPGKKDKPFATLERARDQIRQFRMSGKLHSGVITVELRGGVYELSQPFELMSEDSGTEKSPILYRSRKGETVRIIGGRAVTGWKQVTDPAVLTRLDESARANVWQADLKALGISDLEGIGRAGVYQSDPGLELFFRDKPITLSRYPNSTVPGNGILTATPRSSISGPLHRCHRAKPWFPSSAISFA